MHSVPPPQSSRPTVQAGYVSPLLVGTSLVADHDEHLLFFSQDLSRRLGLPVKLVHACEKGYPQHGLRLWFESLMGHLIPLKTSESILLQAEKTLSEIARRLSLPSCGGRMASLDHNSVKISAAIPPEIRRERPAGQAISLAAKESKAAYVVVGAREPSLWSNWGASTVRSLMTQCPCPLFILRRDLAIDPSREDLRIVLADDLNKDGLRALKVAFNLMERLGAASLIHVHVAPPQATDADLEAIGEILRARSAPYLPSFKSTHTSYRGWTTRGFLLPQLNKAVYEFDADLLIAGCPRKELASTEKPTTRPEKPATIAPFQLLTLPCALLVVPQGVA